MAELFRRIPPLSRVATTSIHLAVLPWPPSLLRILSASNAPKPTKTPALRTGIVAHAQLQTRWRHTLQDGFLRELSWSAVTVRCRTTAAHDVAIEPLTAPTYNKRPSQRWSLVPRKCSWRTR